MDEEWIPGRNNRLFKSCDCAAWEPITDGPRLLEPGLLHTRERVPETTVDVCYFRDDENQTVTILKIETMDE